MEIECDLASIRDEDLLRKMWQQSEDFGRKKEIRSHLYKLRESRLRDFYSTGGLGGDIMNPATDLSFGKSPLTPSHGDSLVGQSFQSLKSKEIRDSESPTREIKFRNSGGVAGGILVPDTTGWDVQTSSEVSPDGRAFRTETLAKTDGVEKIAGGRAEFAGRNEQKSSASHQGDDKNFVKKAAESSKTHLQEKIVVGDENSGRTEMKSSSVTSSSSKVVSSSSSSQVISGGDPGFNLEPRQITNDDQYQKVLSSTANNRALRSEQQQYQKNERNERNETTSSNVRDTIEENKKYVDMDKASPQYQQHVQYLMSQPGAIVSNIVEYPKPGVKMITTVKQLPDGTTVKTKRYETDASVDTGSISQTMKQQQQHRTSSSSTQKTTEKRVQDSEDVFTRLARPRDSSGPASPRITPETPSQDDIYSRLQKSRGEQKFSDSIDQRSTQILRETNQHPNTQSPRNVPIRRGSDLVDNVELISTNKSVKKDLNQTVRNEKITSSDFIQTERDRYVLDHDSPSRRAPDGIPEALAPITPSRHGRPQPDDTPTNGYPSTAVIQQSSKSSAKFSESRRYSTETVESYQHSESHNENQDFTTTQGFPSVRRPIEEPKGRSPTGGRPSQDFSTHGFPSVRADKPTQQYPTEKPSTNEQYNTTERVHIITGDRPRPGVAYPQSPDSTTTTRANYSTNESRRHVTSTTDDFSTHGFPSVRAGTPTKDSPRRPLGSEPASGESPRRPSGPESPANHVRRLPSDGFSTHGFPSVKTASPTGDSPIRPSGTEPTNQGRRPTTDGYPSAKPGRTTPTQSTPQYDDSTRTPNRRPISVDRDDTISVSSDRSNSITYEKKIDAAHQAFARSLRCASPVESIRRDSVSDRPTPKTSTTSIRNSYSPSKRDGRSPSHESITNSESSRISSGTITKSPRPDIRRVPGPKSPIGKTAPSHVSNETIDITLTRKITARPTDKPTGRPSPAKEQSNSAEPNLRKKIFAATENFLASEAVEPILKKEQYYQLGPSDATLPSSRLKTRQRFGATPTTSRRPTTYNTEEEVNTLLDTATKHTTPSKPTTPTTAPTRSARTQDTKPNNPETLYSNKPKTKPEGYVSQERATEITEKHNQTTNKQVSYPHYIPSAPKADRSSPYPERPQTSPSSDRPTKNVPLSAPTTTSTTTHNAPKSTTDRPKVAPSTKPSSSPSKVDNNIRFTKTVNVDNAITRDTTKTRREPETKPLREPKDIDEGYGPDAKGQRRPKSKRPTSDDEGFEPDSPRAGSPTSDFEYRRPTQTETYDEEDSIFKKVRKTDKKTITNEFLDTERVVKQPRRPEDKNREPSYLTDRDVKEPRRPGDLEPNGPSANEPRRPKGASVPEDKNRKPSNLIDEPNSPKDQRRPEDQPSHPLHPTDSAKPRGSKPPLDRSETFDERCRQILGMENETTIDRAKRVQDFIDTERVTVYKKPNSSGRRSPSPQKKQPSDTVSIEDCDDDDNGVIRRYPSEKTTTSTRTTKTTKDDYGRDRSPTAKPGDNYPRDRSPLGKTPRGTRPNEFDETTVTTTTRTIENDRSTSTRPRETSPLGKLPRGTKPTEIDETRPGSHSPTEKFRSVDENTVRSTTIRDTTIVDKIDERSPSTRPRDGSPLGKTPRSISPTQNTSNRTTTIRDTTYEVDHPRDRSPSKKPIRGSSPTDETFVSTSTTTTRDTTATGDHYPTSRPRGQSPSKKEPTSTVYQTTTDSTIQETIDDVFERSHPRDRSPSEKPRKVSPDTTVKRTTTTTTEYTNDDSSYPRDRSPSEKPTRGPRPTDVEKTTTRTGNTITTTEFGVEDRPRSQSPSDKPRRQRPVDSEDTDETFVQRTTKSTKDTSVHGRSPRVRPTEETDTEDYPQTPKGTRPSQHYETSGQRTITDVTVIDNRTATSGPRAPSPSEKSNRPLKPGDRSPSPRSKPSDKYPRIGTTIESRSPKDGSPKDYPHGTSPTEKSRRVRPTDEETEDTYLQTTIETTTSDSDSPNDRPRGTSPSEKPRKRQPTDEYVDETIEQRTTKATTKRTTLKEVTDRSPKDHPREKSPTEKPSQKDYPRDRSPTGKPSPVRPTKDTLVQRTVKTTIDRNTVDDRSPKDRPRERSPTEKPTQRDYPRNRSPTGKPGAVRPTEDTIAQKTVKTTIDRTTVDDRSPKDRPRGTSPTEKPRRRQPSDEEIDVTVVQRTAKTTRDRTTLEETVDHSQKDRYPEDRPRDRSPTEKPRRPKPTDETVVRSTVKTTTIEERSPKGPRGISPSEKPSRRDYPRDRSPTEKPRGPRPTSETVTQRTVKTTTDHTTAEERSPRDHPRGTSPSEKPRRRRPSEEDTDETIIETTTETRRVEGDLPKQRPRGTSPSEKPKRYLPTDKYVEETGVQRTTRITNDRTNLEEIDFEERSPKGRPREKSPSEKPTSRGRSPTEKPRQPGPTGYAVKTTIDRTSVEDRSPNDRPRGSSPSEKPRRHQPTGEEIDTTVVQRTSKTTREDRTTLEEFEDRLPRDRPRSQSPSEKPIPRNQPRDISTNGEIDKTLILVTTKSTTDRTSEDRYPEYYPEKPSIRERSPSGKPSGPRPNNESVLHTTMKTTTVEDRPRGTSPSEKPRRYIPSDEETDETYVQKITKTIRDNSPTDKPSSRTYPRDSSPSYRPRQPKEVDETTVRSSTTRTTLQETDFEKRYPKGRPTGQSPVEKPSTRGPSKPTTISNTTTTTRNRSTLEEHDITRPKTQPSVRDKVPTKNTQSSPRSQPTTDRRIPAELPSPIRKPKSTLGTTTKTTTQTIVTKVPTTRTKTTKDVPKKPTKLITGPNETRPGARQPERKHSPSISPDSSPSRPTSEIDLESPYRSPNISPSRKSPSPARSVKLDDITSSVVTTKKTTVSIDKSKPKVTHITTAKFQVSPPTSPTKVIGAPELNSPSSRRPISKAPTPKPTGSRLTTEKTTTKKTTTIRKDGIIPTDSERDSEVPTDFEDVDSPLSQRTPTRKLPVTERKESAPVHRVTQVDKDVQKMSRSTSENIIKTPFGKRPLKHEPLEPITQREATKPTGGKTSPKTERRPSKHLSTKTINLTTFDKVINSQDMENVVIDIQQAKSSREPSPNKIVPTPVSVDLYTGNPRYPDVVQEPEDEPRKKPNVKNIPIFEEETSDFVGCQITEVNEDSLESTTKTRTRKFIDGEARPQRPAPKIVAGDNVDNECLLSVHDKVSKFISTAEEVSKPKTSAPFRRDVPEEDVPEDDECLLTVDEKVHKFMKTAEGVTREVITSTPKPIERPRIDDLDEDLRTDECVLSVSEKVNKFTTKAEKLAPSAPQRSPELVARIERQISKQSDAEPESPRDRERYPESPEEDDDSPTTVRKVKQTQSLYERDEKKYTERQIDILSRPSVWDKKPKADVKLDDIIKHSPGDQPKPVHGSPRTKSPVKDQPDVAFSKPTKPITDTVSKRKEAFENKTTTKKTTTSTKPGYKSPERVPKRPTGGSPSRKQPSDESDSRYPAEFIPRYVDGYPQEPDDVHEDVYGSLKSRRSLETSSLETTTIQQSPTRSPTQKSSHPVIRPTTQTPTRTPKQPKDQSPSRRYSDDHSPRHQTRDQPQTDRYVERREVSEYTTRRRSSTQKYPEDHSPDRRTPHGNSPSPSRRQPVEEPEDYTFSSTQAETNKHHTTRTTHRNPKDTPLTQTSIPDDEDYDHSPARSTSTISSQKRTTTHRTTSNRLTEDTTSRRPRRPSSNEPTTPTSSGRGPRPKGVPETVAARRNIFENSPGDVSPRPGHRRPSYMDHTKSSLEHTRRDSLEITKTNYSRKSSMEDEPYEASPRSTVKFGVGLKYKEEPKPRRKISSSDIPNIEDVFELDLLEEMLNIVTLYEQRRRIRAQIRVVKKLLETKTKEEVSRMTKITTFRKTSSSSVRDSPIPRRDTPMRPDRYQPSDDIDSESIIESRHVEEREEIIRERSISPQTKTSKTVTKVTEVRKVGEPLTPKRTVPRKEEPKESKPIWATKNILKKPSENEKVARALSAKKTTSTSSSSTSRTQQTHRQRIPADEDCITSSYGIGPTDDDGRPLFGIRALKKKTSKTAQPSETTKVTGTVITEKYYSENGAEPVGERKVTVYSSNPEDLLAMETQYDRRDSETVKREGLSKDGLTSVTKVQKIGKYKPGEVPAITDDPEFAKATSKTVRRGSVKEMSEKFIRKESSSSVTEKSSGYPKAGLILRTRTNSGATADTADQYEVRGKSVEYDDESDNDCDVEIRTSRKHSRVVTESDDETEIRRKVNTRSFLNSTGSKVTGVDDVLDRMRNADNVVVDGDTLEDREARALLNKFLGASVLMTGMESIIPQKELKKTTTGADNLKKQGVKTTRVTKTIKTAAAGGNSSSPVARETCDFEEIWDEETLKELLEKSTSYEERRSIRARLRQLMADREACAEKVASVKAELNNDKKVKTTSDDKKIVEQQQPDDDSSSSEYEEIIEEYTASEDEEEIPTVKVDKKKEEVKEEAKTNKITEEVKTTITTSKKEEPKQTATKTIVVEKTTVVKKDATPSIVEQKKKEDNDDETAVSDNSKGESLLIPLLQGLLHKNMPQARSSSSTSKTATTNTTASAYQNSNNLKSSLKSNNTHFSSTSSNNNNSVGDSGLSSEVSKNSSLGQGGSSLRVTAQQIEDSGTESGEDLRLIAAGLRDSMQIEGIENQSDMSLIKEVTNALNRLESSLKEGKDLALDNNKKNTLLALVERLQTGLTAPDKLPSDGRDEDLIDETSSPEADNHRSNRQRFAKRRNRNNRHTVGVSKEELADARRYMEEMVMIENLSNCTTPECNAVTTPPQLFAVQKQNSTGAILTSHDQQETSSSLFRPNQFVPSNLKHSTEAGSAHPDVQLRSKKANPASSLRQSVGDVQYMNVTNPDSGKRPLSDSYDSYSAQNNRVTFSDTQDQGETYVQGKNQYNRSHHSDNQPDVTNRMSPDSMRFNRFNKKQLLKRANTIDIPKTHHYNPEFDTDSDFEDKSTFNVKGLRGTVQVSVKRKPRQVVPHFEPKTENDHKFLAFIKKQNATPGLGWNSSKSVSNWTNKFGNIKNVFESGAAASNFNRPTVSASPASSAKTFWKKTDDQNPPKVSTSVLTSALRAKERNEQRSEVVVPKPIHLNKFSHNPQSAFRPIDTTPEPIHMQFKPIPLERPVNLVNNYSPTKAYNPVSPRKPVMESPNYTQSSPTKSWVKKKTATNSPVTLPWTIKPPENSVLKLAATKFETKPPLNAVQRHHSFKQQEAQKRPSLPNAAYPYQYQYETYSPTSYISNSQPASYADYTQSRIAREDSLTNPRAEPLMLTASKPAYSPHSLQPLDYYAMSSSPNAHQTDMTDDDIDDMESMTEYRVEAKVMGKPVSQQAVTIGKRTAHVSDDEVFGKNSRAAKSLLSVMKNIGNGGPEKVSKKVERKIAPSTCMSPDGRSYQAPLVEPLFPEVTKFEPNRLPEYIGTHEQVKQQPRPPVEYKKNPAYIPLVDYEHKQPPVAPPRGRKASQETRNIRPYLPQERPNVNPQPRREVPGSLPLQTGPIIQPNYPYNSPNKTPEMNPYTPQIINDGIFEENVSNFRQPYSGPNTPDSYLAPAETRQPIPPPRDYSNHSQYNPTPKGYPGPQPLVNLPQIPLETSFTKVYDQPRDVNIYYQPPIGYESSSTYPNGPNQTMYSSTEAPKPQVQNSPKIQQSPQPLSFAPQGYQQKSEIPEQYYQSIKQSPQTPPFVQQQVHQPRTEVAPQYYQSPKVQQSPQTTAYALQQAYQSNLEDMIQEYQSPKIQQLPQPPSYNSKTETPTQYYQSPIIQKSPQPPTFAPQQAEVPSQYYQSPKIQQSPQMPVFAPERAEIPPQYYQSPKVQQSPQPTTFVPQQTYQPNVEVPVQQYQSPNVQQFSQPPSFVPKTEDNTQYYQSPKTQQSPQQSLSPPYQPKAPVLQQTPKQVIKSKPRVPAKSDTVTKTPKPQPASRTQQQSNKTVVPASPVVQPPPSNTAILCKQASLDGRNRVQSQSQLYEKVEEVRRKSLGNVLEITRLEREAREQKAAAIKQDMYSVQQDVYSHRKAEFRQQETVVYKSSAPDDTPDIVKSSLAKDDIPILKKFGPPQRHCYVPNAYQNPLSKSETTTIAAKPTQPVHRKFSEPTVSRGPVIVEIPATPQPEGGQDEIPRNIVLNNVSAFTSMSRRYGESFTESASQQNRPNKLSKCDSWNQICQLQNAPQPPSPKFNNTGSSLRRTKSGHTLALPKLYEAGYDRSEITEKQKTVAAYFSGQKSPNSLSRNSSQTNLVDESTTVSVKKSSINRIKTSEKASTSRRNPSSGLSRSHTMPHIANVSLLDESNVDDAFEQLMNALSTTTTEKTETKEEDGGVVTTTTKVTTRTVTGAPKPVSPFAKFQQLDKQVSLQSPKSPLTPSTPGGSSTTQIFRFTDPALNARVATFKDQLLQWCQSKTQEYENVQITNFSGSWTDGLAFCALIHHFLPDAFDYSKLSPKQRRYNFELAFRVADEKAGIAPLLDVEDMVVMKRPDWKCVFTYVQSIYRRFRNCQ